MSFHTMEYVDGLDISPMGAKYILYRIALMIDDATLVCFPGQDFLAKMTSCSQSQVKRHIAALVATGTLIRHERKNTHNGLWKSNVYEISGFGAWLARRKAGDYWDPKEALKASLVARQYASTEHPCPVDENSVIHGASMPPTTGHPRPVATGHPCPLNSKSLESKESKERLSSQISAKDAYLAGESAPKKPGRAKRQGSLPIEETEAAKTDVDGLAKMDEADVKAFCAVADEFGLAKPERLSGLRRDKLRGIRREYGGSAWRRALDAIRASSFLQGRAKAGFRVSFDKLLDPEFFQKVIEGNFADERGKVVKLKTRATPQEWHFRLQVWQRSGFERWSDVWGPRPGEADCAAPPDLIQKFRDMGMPEPDAVTQR